MPIPQFFGEFVDDWQIISLAQPPGGKGNPEVHNREGLQAVVEDGGRGELLLLVAADFGDGALVQVDLQA